MFGLFCSKENTLDIGQDDWGSDGRLIGDAETTYRNGDYDSVSQDGGSPIEMTETDDGRIVAKDDI